MKKMFLLLITIIVSLSVFSQDFWSPLQTPNNESVYSIGVTRTGITFIGTSSGLYKSVDDGLNWKKIDSINISVYSIYIDKDDRIFAAPRDKGYFHYSVDYGTTWQKINRASDDILTSIYVNGDNIFVYGWDFIEKTVDLGVTWSSYTDFSGVVCVNKIVENESGILYAGVYAYVAGGGGLFYSDNYGETWVDMGLYGNPYSGVLDCEFDWNGDLYFTDRCNMFYTVDAGASWIICPQFMAEPCHFVFDNYNKAIYVASSLPNNVISRSFDNGETWELINDGIASNAKIYQLCVSSNGYIFAFGSGLYRSTNKIFSSVNNIISPEISIYPNPATNFININTDQFLNNKISSITITDISGREMNVSTVNNARIDISNLNEGTYIITVSAGNKVYRSKFLVMR